MKPGIYKIFRLILPALTMFTLAACGSGGSSGVSGAVPTTVTASSGTGAIVANVDSAVTSNDAVKSSENAMFPKEIQIPGVVTVRFTVSGSGMTNMTKDFAVSAGRGTIDAIPAGTGRTLSVQGLNSSGTVIAEGQVTNIAVTEGQTTDVGTVVLTAVTISGTGDISFVLSWTWSGSSSSVGPDIDMFVTDPFGQTLSTSVTGYGKGPTPQGGVIDRDATSGGGPERAYWPTGQAPTGTYTYGVRYFYGTGTANYTFKVYKGTVLYDTKTGVLTAPGSSLTLGTVTN